jgi:hypothetical protein
MLRGWRATAPTHPDAERCRAMFLHFAARVKALLASWDPKGRPAN